MKMFRNMSLLFVAATLTLAVSAQSATGTKQEAKPATKAQTAPAKTAVAPAKSTKTAPAKTETKPAPAKKTTNAVKPADNKTPQK